jgi:putative SOS response-associated peptidase YedK
MNAMCSNYESIADPKRLAENFNVLMPEGAKFEVWPAYQSIFIRRPKEADVGDDAVPDRESQLGAFGLVPHWTRAINVDAALVSARRTYNARTETVNEKPSFRDAWRKGQHCIVPAEGIFEPDWRSGKSVRTRISRKDGKPMGIAGLWTGWKSPEGHILRSFTMLTINADEHALMKNYHKPEDEKRMVVILNEDSYDAWLKAPADKSMDFMRQYPAELLRAVPAALPPLAKKKPSPPTEMD